MSLFKCVKPTTFKGRQATVGVAVRVNDKNAAALKDNPCWKEEKPAAPKVDKDTIEAQRLGLLEQAKAMGLKPNARLGVAKLEKLIADAQADPASII